MDCVQADAPRAGEHGAQPLCASDAAGEAWWNSLITLQREYAVNRGGAPVLSACAWSEIGPADRAKLLSIKAVTDEARDTAARREQALLVQFPVDSRVLIERNERVDGRGYAGRTGTVTRANSLGGWYVKLDRTPRERADKEVLIVEGPSNKLMQINSAVSGQAVPTVANTREDR